MEQKFLKKDLKFYNKNFLLFMYDLSSPDNEVDEVVEAIHNVYRVDDYVIKGNFIYANFLLGEQKLDEIDLTTAYTYCIKTYSKSYPYFESELDYLNIFGNKDYFFFTPNGADVFDLVKCDEYMFKNIVVS